jgi:hypothetical protein
MCTRTTLSCHDQGRLGTDAPTERDQCGRSASTEIASYVQTRAQRGRDGDAVHMGDIGGAEIRDLDANSVTSALTNVGTPRDEQGKWHRTRHGTRTSECGHSPERCCTEPTEVGRNASLPEPGDVMARRVEWILAASVVTSSDPVKDPCRGCASHAVPTDAVLLRLPRGECGIPRMHSDELGKLHLRRMGHRPTLCDVHHPLHRTATAVDDTGAPHLWTWNRTWQHHSLPERRLVAAFARCRHDEASL